MRLVPWTFLLFLSILLVRYRFSPHLVSYNYSSISATRLSPLLPRTLRPSSLIPCLLSTLPYPLSVIPYPLSRFPRPFSFTLDRFSSIPCNIRCVDIVVLPFVLSCSLSFLSEDSFYKEKRKYHRAELCYGWTNDTSDRPHTQYTRHSCFFMFSISITRDNATTHSHKYSHAHKINLKTHEANVTAHASH